MGLGVRHNARAGPAFYIIQGIPLISNMREGGSSKQPQKIEHPIKPMTREELSSLILERVQNSASQPFRTKRSTESDEGERRHYF